MTGRGDGRRADGEDSDERERDGEETEGRPVGETYDRIAAHFSRTRANPWPEVVSFLEGRRVDRALDVGCGNGRHAEVLAEHAARVVGVDASAGLLAVARDRALERGYADAVSFVRGDAGSLPVRNDAVGLALYVATLHHLRPRERRVVSLSELARVLAPGGRALVSAWSTEHDRFETGEGEPDDGSNDHADASRITGFDTQVDWTLPDGETVPRFYHIYAPAEFRADLDASALRPVETFVSSGNCYAVVAPAPSDLAA